VPPVIVPGERVLSGARCRQIDSDDSVPLGRTFLGCTGEAIEPIEKAYSRETGGLEDADELCIQQSTGDSTSPQVDVSKGAVGQNFANDDVGDLGATATFQHPCDLADGPCFVRHKIEHAIRDDDIDCRVLDREIRRIAVPDLDVREAANPST
jgi:hypothetical protein